MWDLREQIRLDWPYTGQWIGALVLTMLLDIVCGTVNAFVARSVDSTLSRKGIARKLLALGVVAFFVIFDSFAPPLTIPVVGSVTWAAATCFGMLVWEGISLIEKAGNLGVPIPKVVREALVKVRDGLGGQAEPTSPPKEEA